MYGLAGSNLQSASWKISQTPGLSAGAPASSAWVNSGALVNTTLQAPSSVSEAITSQRHMFELPRPYGPYCRACLGGATIESFGRGVRSGPYGAPGAIQVTVVSEA